jgi:hypothetical protein
MVEDTSPSTSCCGNEESEEDEEDEEEGGFMGLANIRWGDLACLLICALVLLSRVGERGVVWCPLPGATVHNSTQR